ncbi:MAG: diguanylate cyclase, partial [Acidobacteria bacterium]|nr:diguanylate cyclase [Acidobacteriota bacterium]
VGVAATWAGRATADDLLRRADDAVYRAKSRGRNQVVA